MIYIVNAFSLSMLKLTSEMTLKVQEVSTWIAKRIISSTDWISAVGHEDTAKVMSEILNIEVPANRIAIHVQEGDTLLVFQLLDRLPEGKILTSEELKHLRFRWYVVWVGDRPRLTCIRTMRSCEETIYEDCPFVVSNNCPFLI